MRGAPAEPPRDRRMVVIAETQHAPRRNHIAFVNAEPERGAEYQTNRRRREDQQPDCQRGIGSPRDQLGMYHAVIGTMLSKSVKGDEAIAELQQARELDPKLADNLLDK